MTKDPLVTVDWLAQRLNDVIVLDATYFMPADAERVLREFHDEHVPGASLFEVDEIVAPGTELPHMLPPADVFGRAMAQLGIDATSTVVVYDRSTNHFSAPRVWFTLRLFSVENAYVLDGGLNAWKAASMPLERGEARERSNGRPAFPQTWKLNSARVLSGPDMLRQVNAANNAIVDARSRERFDGIAPEPRPGLTSGHMPGATCVPFSLLTASDGSFASTDQLRALFAEIDGPSPIVTCGSGMTACVLALGLERIGLSARLYDGSWAQWGQGTLGEIVRKS
jgi:thiosulfate/3-mercaptopyruvate sulfurtransferase